MVSGVSFFGWNRRTGLAYIVTLLEASRGEISDSVYLVFVSENFDLAAESLTWSDTHKPMLSRLPTASHTVTSISDDSEGNKPTAASGDGKAQRKRPLNLNRSIRLWTPQKSQPSFTGEIFHRTGRHLQLGYWDAFASPASGLYESDGLVRFLALEQCERRRGVSCFMGLDKYLISRSVRNRRSANAAWSFGETREEKSNIGKSRKMEPNSGWNPCSIGIRIRCDVTG